MGLRVLAVIGGVLALLAVVLLPRRLTPAVCSNVTDDSTVFP